ncbi:VCBS repeat-containing protein [Afipia massiliensis]|uniref:VCBS repeat-containing protein n=1 Tax=Afipia massiliensis TaxID=211460 RepID=A0A840MQK6_9BRAD|nr:VCBS domain-containing protein [Afipia massiliensis]MBB5050075.1 VCBS repeat-containing protein [Afipia massiliensis]
MNFAGPFDSEFSHDSPVSLGGERFTFDSKPGFVQHHASDSHVVVPDAHLLFSGDYTRIGSDLIISGNNQKFVVGNYFKGETRPALSTKDGATLGGHIVDALTGHVHYAQATAAPAAGTVIGTVQKMSGSASVIRNGVSVELQIGAAVQKGDVIQTGSNSSIGMTFVDGSAFGMTSNARMVLNEMIFDPNGSSNSSLMSLVQGTVTFVAGQTAKNGNMRVETPVATMGIRGTAVLVEIAANDGPTKFSVLVEPDGTTGSFNLYDKVTGQLIGTVSQAGQVTFVSSLGIGQPPTAIEQLKTLADQQAEKAIIQQVFQLYFPNYNPDDSNPKMPKFGSNTSGNNLAEILFTTNSNNKQTFLTQIELRFAVTDPLTGITTYQNRIFYNTKAQFSASSILSEQSFDTAVESFKISDLVHIDDPDIGNAPFYDTATPFVAGSAIIKSAVSTNPNLSANFLTQFLHINQTTGVITFDRLGFNFLGDGESVTFMIQVTSRSGPDVANVIIPITITGDNDVPNDNGAPTIVLSLSDVVGAVKEDALVTPDHAIVKNGTITFRDVDLSDGHQAGVVFTSSTSGSTLNPISNPSLPGFGPNAHIGTFTIGPVVENETDTINTGTVGWHFTLDENDPTLQSLAEGQTITQVYTITITDEHGAFVTQTVTITITGTNDAPVIDAIAATSLNEQTDTGALTLASPIHVTFGDVDLSDVGHTASVTAVTTAGVTAGLSLMPAQLIALVTPITATKAAGSSAGSVDLGFSAPSTAFDYLASGETIKLTYTVTVSDGDGGTTPATFDVTITGTNDAPSVAAITGVAFDEQADTSSLQQIIAVDFTDVDLTDTGHVASVQNVTVTGVLPPFMPAGAQTSGMFYDLLTAVSAQKAVGTSSGSASFDFDADFTTFNYLAEGEVVTLTYTVGITDHTGATGTQTVTVTITGTNDAPEIGTSSAAATAASAEQTGVTGSTSLDAVGGTIGFFDADYSDTHQVTQSAASFVWTGGTLTGLQIAALTAASTQTVVPHDSTGTGIGSIDWTYKITDSALDFLADGDTLTVTYDIIVQDFHGVVANGTSATQQVTVTYAGANDAPTVAAVTTPAILVDTVAADTFVTQSGSLVGSDPDSGETASLTYTAYDSTTSTYGNSAVVGQYGSLTVNSNGTYNYVPNAAAINALNADNYTDTFTVQTTDVHDASGTATFTVNVTGANDAAVIGNPLMAEVREGVTDSAGNLVASGMLSISDVDSADSFNTTVANATGHTNLGTLSLQADGQYVYSVLNSNPSVQALTGVQTRLDVFTIQSQDGTSKDISFTINGVTEIASTSANETLVETAGRDNFVFAPASGQDTIMDFSIGSDKIDLKALSGMTASALTTLLSTAEHVGTGGADLLLHLNGNTDTVLLKGVTALNASDFILHA